MGVDPRQTQKKQHIFQLFTFTAANILKNCFKYKKHSNFNSSPKIIRLQNIVAGVFRIVIRVVEKMHFLERRNAVLTSLKVIFSTTMHTS